MTPLRVQLREDQLLALRALADRRGTSLSAIVREAIDRFISVESTSDDPLLDIIGLVDGGPPDASERHDDYLAEIYADEHHSRIPGRHGGARRR
jgi:hypothetical protein